jgi:hypothetical protein
VCAVNLDPADTTDLRNELIHIRDRVTRLLDSVDTVQAKKNVNGQEKQPLPDSPKPTNKPVRDINK